MSTRRLAVCSTVAALYFWQSAFLSLAQTKNDPARELWAALKKALLADNGDEYFRTTVKNAEMTPLKGLVIAVLPNGEAKKAMVTMSDAETADITLILPQGKAKMEVKAGAEIEFTGVAVAFTKTPFMFTVDLIKVIQIVPRP